MEPGILYSKLCESLRGINFLQVLAWQAMGIMGSEGQRKPSEVGCWLQDKSDWSGNDQRLGLGVPAASPTPMKASGTCATARVIWIKKGLISLIRHIVLPPPRRRHTHCNCIFCLESVEGRIFGLQSKEDFSNKKSVSCVWTACCRA